MAVCCLVQNSSGILIDVATKGSGQNAYLGIEIVHGVCLCCGAVATEEGKGTAFLSI